MRLAFPGLMAALAEGATIVTPTPLLASVAVEQFNRAQLSAGRQSWERPDIQSLDAWMTTCWQQARYAVPNAPSLLSVSQERELWRQVIENDRSDLFDVRAMAVIAQRASRVLAEYQIQTEGEAWSEHADAASFLHWYQAVQQKLKSENWITRSELWRLLPHWINKGFINPGPVTFPALTSISPSLKTLSRALGDSVQIVGITPSAKSSIARASQHASIAHEIEHAARAIRYLLETAGEKSIGVLVTDLPTHSRDLLRILNQVLYPASAPDDHIHLVSGKQALLPLISNALLLLELAQPRLHFASAGAILRSPFIDGARKERSARALADNKLRRARELDFSDSEIKEAVWDCPILFQLLGRVEKVKKKLAAFMRPPDWSTLFSDILEAAKWPSIENITEAERLAIDKWSAALSELASLGLVSPEVSLNQALSHLRAILNRPAEMGSWSSPIQILDANSSEAIEFDYSFIINASEEAWPAPITLSPLIPYKLQRVHQVPASQPESAAEERSRKTIGLISAAPSVHVSYTGTLSPLIKPYTTADDSALAWTGETAHQSYAAADLDSEVDIQAPQVRVSQEVRGGAGILKAQSLCPFKAFAEYRLNARGDDEACFGFDALERGECAHRALEYIWLELGNQQKLKALSRDELQSLVTRHVAQAVKDDAANGPIRALTSLAERDRLVNVIAQWLEIEKQRSSHFTVERVEEKRDVELSELKLSLRMDRVDRLADGSLILIDYKSGAQSAKKLVGDRPKEPQLLVYAATIDEPIDGIYFGELRNRKARPVGHGGSRHFPQQRGTEQHNDWDAFLDRSKDTVHRLISEFRKGDAAVNPQPGACDYCKIKPICRVSTVGVAEEGDE